jgi:hypothetical protein
MVNGMAIRETSELGGGEGAAFCPESLFSWVFAPVLGESGSWSRGGANFLKRLGPIFVGR